VSVLPVSIAISFVLPRSLGYFSALYVLEYRLLLFLFASIVLRKKEDGAAVFNKELSNDMRFIISSYLVLAIVFSAVGLVIGGYDYAIAIAIGYAIVTLLIVLAIWLINGGLKGLIKKIKSLKKTIKPIFRPAFQS
jgi:hypothetical protein